MKSFLLLSFTKFLIVVNILWFVKICCGDGESNTLDSSTWPQFDMVEHVPGEPLSPIDYQNADLMVNIPPPNTPFSKDPIELAGLYEGDIILTDRDKVPGHREQVPDDIDRDNMKNAINKDTQKWPGGVIPYFIAAQFSPVERSTIARAFLEYQRQTCIVFKPRTNEADYIHIMKGNGCSSHVGRTGGAQPVILGNGCVYPGIAMHELMHAVGFWHEQSRWDRDDFVTVYYQNVQPNMEFNFQKYNWNTIQNLGVQYDTGSILHYGPYAFAKDKRFPTILPKVGNEKMGQRTTFSANDVMKINRLYHCNGNLPGPATAGTGVTEPVIVTTIKPPAAETGSSRCLDTHKYCPDWSARGECKNNPAWMLVNCKKSCNRCNSPCADSNQFCSIWAQSGECSKNPDYMKTYCPKSCATCVRETEVVADASACNDQHIHCSAWADRGECTLNPNYMLKKCRKACKACVVSRNTDPSGLNSGMNLKLQKYQLRFDKIRQKMVSEEIKKEL